VDPASDSARARTAPQQAYWRSIGAVLEREKHEPVNAEFTAELAVAADVIIEEKRIVNWVRNQNNINQLELRIGDLVYDRCKERGVPMSLDLAELVARGIVAIAKEQRA
jgi:hypothetical protein